MKIVVLADSSRGSGLIAGGRSVLRALEARGHDVLVLQPAQRPRTERRARPRRSNTRVYRSVNDLKTRYTPRVRNADVVIVGSRIPKGIDVGTWVTRVARGVTAFYDNDAEATLSQLKVGAYEAVSPALIPKYKLYLSNGASESTEQLQKEFRSPMARAFDPDMAPDNRAAELERFVAEAMTGRLMA